MKFFFCNYNAVLYIAAHDYPYKSEKRGVCIDKESKEFIAAVVYLHSQAFA